MQTRKQMVAVLVAMVLLAGTCGATALTAARNTPQYEPGNKLVLTVGSNVQIFAGSIVCMWSNSLAYPGADTASYAVVGRANETVDNRTAVYDADATIEISKGIFRWANADSIVQADIGKIVYVTDDATVNKTGGGNAIIAGTVWDVDSSGVWVDTGKIGPIGAATPSSLAVSGNASVVGSLSVTGAQTNSGTLRVVGGTTLSGGVAVTGTTVGSGTIQGSGYLVPGGVGWTGTVTNKSSMSTNLMYYSGGICTNTVNNP